MLKSLPDDIVLLAIFNYLDGYDLISYLKLSKYFHNCNTNFSRIHQIDIDHPIMLGFDEIFDRLFISFRSTIKKLKIIKNKEKVILFIQKENII